MQEIKQRKYLVVMEYITLYIKMVFTYCYLEREMTIYMRNAPLVRGNKLNKRVKRNKVRLSDLPEFYAVQKNWHCFLLIIEIKKMSYFKILQDSFCPALQIKIFHLMASR